MPLSWSEIQANAITFSKRWKDATDEEAQAQSFLNEFFSVFGIDRKRVGTFEKKVPMGKNRNGYIDLLWKGVILIEMKSRGKNLDRAYAQARDYAFNLDDEDLPEYVMVCDFENIRLYRQTTNQIWNFKTVLLYKNIKLFSALAGYKASNALPEEMRVDRKAAEKMAKLHDLLKAHGYEGHNLEVYLVRLLFCLFADDTGIFEKNIFFEYVSNSRQDGSDLAMRLAALFQVLNTSPQEREKQQWLTEELKKFSYINGKLFAEPLPIAGFNIQTLKMLRECCSLEWGYISPAIFGAMFQGVMNPIERREFGAHYTSEENILKVIKPLFLDELRFEFEQIKGNSQQRKAFHEKLGRLKFLDPACGCGNFLIIAYRELRLLELDLLAMEIDNSNALKLFDVSEYCKIDVDQFYGIEYEEFPAQIAQLGLWLTDHQMNMLVAEQFGQYFARLPLTHSATIVHGNALTLDWSSIVSKNDLSCIMGNPPFVGSAYQTAAQKSDMALIFEDSIGAGQLDYVAAWYRKSAKFVQGTSIRSAFVSTNSITQGEQVSMLWKPLLDQFHIQIDFAYRTFRWSNDAKGNAAVHCVIIGFNQERKKSKKKLFYSPTDAIDADNINPYLIDAPNIIVESRTTPLCNVPRMHKGSQPTDGGNLVLSSVERDELISHEPQSARFIKQFLGSDEFLNGKARFCLWLVNATPNELKSCSQIMSRVAAVRSFRLESKKEATRRWAEQPALFTEIRHPSSNYLVIPEVSSEKRRYIPIGFLTPETICSNKLQLVPNATLYELGILSSNVHMAWMRMVCGRLKSDYDYSGQIVYNNFPWPNPTKEQKLSIEVAASGILDAREKFPESSLSDMYNPLTMPNDLLRAHKALDIAVMSAYGYSLKSTTEEKCAADLLRQYDALIKSQITLRL